MNKIKIIECPRDAMQGIKTFIPTNEKADYINAIFKVAFDTIDLTSFVSPKAIPQFADAEAFCELIDKKDSKTKALAIIGNIKGAERAVNQEIIDYIGFPHSLSHSFLKSNINSSVEDSRNSIQSISELCSKNNKKTVVYLSFAFGNPFNDIYNNEDIIKEIQIIKSLGISVVSIADTIGSASGEDVYNLMSLINNEISGIEIGLHLHADKDNYIEKLKAAFDAKCARFDSALLGFGGCPYSGSKLVGNIDTNLLINFLETENIKLDLNLLALEHANNLAQALFSKYGVNHE